MFYLLTFGTRYLVRAEEEMRRDADAWQQDYTRKCEEQKWQSTVDEEFDECYNEEFRECGSSGNLETIETYSRDDESDYEDLYDTTMTEDDNEEKSISTTALPKADLQDQHSTEDGCKLKHCKTSSDTGSGRSCVRQSATHGEKDQRRAASHKADLRSTEDAPLEEDVERHDWCLWHE
jgi:hypothetical protein